MDILLDMISWVLLPAGSFFCISGGVGVWRFPDFYTRMHAAGVTDTLGAALILIGLMLQAPDGIVLVKLILILLFTLLTGPTASHALAKSALHGNLQPLMHDIGDDGKAGSGS
ncbi:MAG TPA: monovalent cation/H(+) antiporter subunit G [Gammaproteobacteria bacterium]